MNRYQALCYEFQNAPGGMYAPTPSTPTKLPERYVTLWHWLISEELEEYLAARDLVAQAHEQCDLLYVLYGLAVWQGLVIPSYVEQVPFYQVNEMDTANNIRIQVNLLLVGLGKGPHYSYLTLTAALGWVHTNPPPGVRLWPVFQAVHAANMAKMEGGAVRFEGGKILKPEGWQPADVRSVLQAQGIEC